MCHCSFDLVRIVREAAAAVTQPLVIVVAVLEKLFDPMPAGASSMPTKASLMELPLTFAVKQPNSSAAPELDTIRLFLIVAPAAARKIPTLESNTLLPVDVPPPPRNIPYPVAMVVFEVMPITAEVLKTPTETLLMLLLRTWPVTPSAKMPATAAGAFTRLLPKLTESEEGVKLLATKIPELSTLYTLLLWIDIDCVSLSLFSAQIPTAQPPSV